MARELTELPKRAGGRKAKYDYDLILDGTPRAFAQGTDDEVEAGVADFSCNPATFISNVRRVATDRGITVATRNLSESEVAIEAVLDNEVDNEADLA